MSLNYGVIGNRLTAALISEEGSIDWCCFPRFDSPSVFAKILDSEKGGCFSIEPTSDYETEQEYLEDTNVLSTTYLTESGDFEVLDYFPVYIGPGRSFQGPQEIHRLIKVRKGKPRIEVSFDPRFDYARDSPDFHVENDVLVAEGEGEMVSLTSNFSPKKIIDGKELVLNGDSFLSMSYDKIEKKSLESIEKSLEETKKLWTTVVNNTTLPGDYRSEVVRSLLVLELMRYRESGATVAALTTSLPEIIGGERNWDYRYSWLRDSAMTVESLTNLCHFEEARKFMNWLLSCCEELNIMRDVECEDPPEEETLDHLEGYEGSTPVRIGNEAKDQKQNDIFGEVLESIQKFFVEYEYVDEMTEDQWRVIEKWVNAASESWSEKDHGIWEFRGLKDHYTFSKVMCWVALDRGSKIAKEMGKNQKAEDWSETAEEIRKDILEKGWNEDLKAFTQRYGSESLDASLLLIPQVGFLPPDHPRVLSTIDAIDERLREGSFVFRYKSEDDFGSPENAFTICTLWFVESLYMAGQEEKARAIFEDLLDYSNHLGLFSEDIDPEVGEQTGNFPQAYTHMALINTAVILDETKPEGPECKVKLI